LVLVTRRFWPLVGGAEIMMANLMAGFRDRGVETTLLTARWQADWPPEVVHRGGRVIRLPQPSLRGWGTFQYMRSLQRWLQAHADEFDLAYVSMLKHDAYAAIGGGRKAGFPVVLRVEGAGLTGNVHWQLNARFGASIRRRCQHAAALVAPSEAVERELIAAGYPRGKIHRISNAVPISPRRSPRARLDARLSLATTDRALAIEHDDPLVIYTGRLHAAKGLTRLVAAWPAVLARHRQARLWLVGEGPLRDVLREQIDAASLGGRVILTGAFDQVDGLLAAADVFVLPSHQEGLSVSLLEAMASGLPVVATDIPGNRQLVGDNQCGLLVPLEDDPQPLAGAIVRLLDDAAMSSKLAAHARQRVESHFALDTMVDVHLDLFDRILKTSPRER